MKRFALLLPLLVVVPFALSVAAPAKAPVKPKVVVPPTTTQPKATPTPKPKTPLEESLDTLWQQSDAAFHAGDYPTAVKIHRAIVTLDPTDVESYSVASWLLWSMKQNIEARAFIKQGLDANPGNAAMWDAAGQHYELEQAHADARDAFQKAISFSKNGAPELMRRRLAHAAEKSGDLNLSLQTWTELARDFPNSPVNKNNLARVQALKNRASNTI